MISWKTHFLYQIDYQHWANEKLFDMLDKLSDDARKRDAGMYYKSVHATYNHLLISNLLWFNRLRGQAPDLRLDQPIYEEWRDLKQALRQSLRQTQHWLQAQPNEFFEGELRYRTSSGIAHVNWVHDALSHFVAEYAHQRGQVIAISSQLGAPAPELDFLNYRREMQESLAKMRQAANA
ncbi:DinB family protein [Chitinimonas naiadis]